MSNKVSVIMLTYNRENLVERAIQSILCQTMTDFEYIIVDNGSTDRSGEIAEEYARKDERIKVIHIQKSTIGRGRNVGLSASNGEYITFVDDDDFCKPEYLQTLYELISTEGCDIAICGTDRSVNVERCIYDTKEALITLLERKYYNVGFPTKMIKRTLFIDHMFDEESRYDDIYLMPSIIGAARKIVYEGKPLYIVNRHENNNSAWTTNHKLLSRDTLLEYLNVYRKRTEWLIAKYPEDMQTWLYFEWSFMISMINKVSMYQIEECYDIKNGLVNVLSENKETFLKNPRIRNFEVEWMELYI